MRILITGSRDWDNKILIENGLALAYEELVGLAREEQAVTLVSGHCPTGADFLCEHYARRRGWDVEEHPADWDTHGKRAGFVRNAEMVKLGADVCVAFIKDNSKGATMTARLADEAGINVHFYRASNG